MEKNEVGSNFYAIERQGDNGKWLFSSCDFEKLDQIAQKILSCIDKRRIFQQNIHLNIISKC